MAKNTQSLELIRQFQGTGCVEYHLFEDACMKDQNLKGYLCIPKDKVEKVIKKLKKMTDYKVMYKYLVDNQPCINKTVEMFDLATKFVALDIEAYVTYYAYKLINAFGSLEDYQHDLYAKFYYMVNFYRDRWFFKKTLSKKTKVKWKAMLYKDFLHLARATVSSEKRLKAYKFRLNPEASMTKMSLDQVVTYQGKSDNRKLYILDTIAAEETDSLDDRVDYLTLTNKIRDFAETYENGKYLPAIEKLIIDPKAESSKVEKIVFKVAVYKAGVWRSDKILKFVDNLSRKYKEKFGISQDLINKQKRILAEEGE